MEEKVQWQWAQVVWEDITLSQVQALLVWVEEVWVAIVILRMGTTREIWAKA